MNRTHLSSLAFLLCLPAAACSAPGDDSLTVRGGTSSPRDAAAAADTRSPGSSVDQTPPSSTNGGDSPGEDGGASARDAAADGPSGPGTDAAAALTECPNEPSVDRLARWLASGEGTTVPATGSILVKENGRSVGKVQFVNNEWHVVPVWIANKFDNGQVDLTQSQSFTLTYSATADLYVQIRPASHWSGGDKYLTKIPSTGGQVETHVFSFAAPSWTTLPELGTPAYSYAESLKDVRGLVFVGKTANTIAFYGLRFDGYVPSCP